jgi:hypothetical protein
MIPKTRLSGAISLPRSDGSGIPLFELVVWKEAVATAAARDEGGVAGDLQDDLARKLDHWLSVYHINSEVYS